MNTTTATPIATAAAKARAALAFHNVKAYRVAYHLGCHPASLSLMLNGHRPMPEGLLERIERAIAAEIEAK
jgi:DNA-binding transcriptional regulator YdaS (Cro superfamily)